MRFRGNNKLSVDAKGRFAMPKNHRENLEKNSTSDLIVTADLCGCLLIYPAPIWAEVEDQILALPNHSDYARVIQRVYIGYATEVELDGTGRILLSSELRDYAGMGRKAVLVGQGKKFELWDEPKWVLEQEKWKQQHVGQKVEDKPPELLQISF